MSTIKVIAVFDIGKTNKKILLFNQKMGLAYQHEQKFATTVDEDGSECDDIEKIQNWIIDTLGAIIEEGQYDILGVNFSTYGASLAFLDKQGTLLTPIYNYLKEVDIEIQNELFNANGGVEEFCRRTASPSLGMLLNSGIQALWLKKTKKSLWDKVDAVLHFPQYLSYVLTNQVSSEPTSIGCHTFMWDFDNMQYHPWLNKEGIKVPTPVNNDTVYPAKIKNKEVKVGVGIHDSSASLVPYLANSKEKFILVSTGTWCISMNPYNSEALTSTQLQNDCLCFLTPQNQQVKSSRLFMGHFHEKITDKLTEYFGVDANYFKTVPYDNQIERSLNTQFGDRKVFFPEGIENFDNGLKVVDVPQFKNFIEAYTRMVIELTSLCIDSIKLIIPENDESKIVYVSGGFARNPIFLNILSNYFDDKKVLTSEIDNASALGAAMVISGECDGFSNNNIELTKVSDILV
ncbi:FGGY-family carbohydrate kinase [Saccharicrinis aurantiacus]|uniref:FGGY-family carbohydrate kinase n=1 Tax=Saccharicrinis aurantiacus TaxID=1849719 RepID=UPI002491A27C|nr:FGGY family carbohydrate kinase [Saccharicrinis aurantiacus]